MENVLEDGEAPKHPADLPLHQDFLRHQENNNDKSSVLGDTNKSRVVKKNWKHDSCEDGVERIACDDKDAETKTDSGRDKETSESSVGKLDDNKEKEHGLCSEHDLEVEYNKNTGDCCLTADVDNVGESEDHDDTEDTVCDSAGENMDTCSEETGSILRSKGGFVYLALKDGINESKCEMQVNEGTVHEIIQEHESSYGHGKLKEKDAVASISSNSGVVMESSGMGGSEDKSTVSKDTEKFTEDAEEIEGVTCNNEVVGKRSGSKHSEGFICNDDVVMERVAIGDSEDINAITKDAVNPSEDVEKSEGVTSNDELVVVDKIGIGDSGSKRTVNKDTDKAIENAEIEEKNQNLEVTPVEDAIEMEAKVTQDGKKNKKSIVERIEEEREEMNLDMTEGKEEMDDEMREEKENEMNLEMSEGKEVSAEMAEEKKRDVEITMREKKGVEMTKRKEKDAELTEGKEKDLEMPEEKDIERTEGKEEREVEMGEEKEMSVEMSEETEEICVKRAEEEEKESEVEEECGETRGEGVQEEIKKSQEYKSESKVVEDSQDQTFDNKEKDKGGKREKLPDIGYTSVEKKETQKTENGDVIESTKGSMAIESQKQGKPEERKVIKEISQDSAEETLSHGDEHKTCKEQKTENGDVIELTKGSMAIESQKQDKLEERKVIKEIIQDSAEETLSNGDEHETCKEQNDGVNDLGHAYPLKESQKQTCKCNSEKQLKEANKSMTEPAAAEELQNETSKGQTTEGKVNQSDVLNATEDSLSHNGKYQSEADEDVIKRVDEADAPNQTKQNESEIQEVEKSSSGLRGTLGQQNVEKSNSGQSNEESKTLNQQREVQQDIHTSKVTKESDCLIESQSISSEITPQGIKQSHSGKKLAVEAGQYGKRNNSSAMQRDSIDSETPSNEVKHSSLKVGDTVSSTSNILCGKNNFAKKSTSKINCKTPKSSKDQSINIEEETVSKKRSIVEGGEASPAGLHKQASSLPQHSSIKEAPNCNMAGQGNESAAVMPKIAHMGMSKPGALYVYTSHPGRYLTPMPVSKVISQPGKQTKKTDDSDDSDIEIISEKIVSPRNASVPAKISPMVCDVCQIVWNNNVLEAIFEGSKAVTVNSKITYGAILCFNRYAEARYWQNKEQTLRNVLERADLGKNIGNLRMMEVIKWLSRMMKEGTAKCCDVFDAVYNSANASTMLASLRTPESKDAPELVPKQQNIQMPVEETPKRKTGNSCRVNSQVKASSGTSEPTTPQDASLKVTKPKDSRKAVKSTHTQAKGKESPAISGVVLQGGEATLKKSNVHVPKTPFKNCSGGSSKNPGTHEKVVLKECSVYLGKRLQVPQQRHCLQSVSSSPVASKRKQSFEEIDEEVPCEKISRVVGLPLRDKESTGTGDSTKSEDKKEAPEQTATKKSTVVAYPPTTSNKKQCLEEEVDKELPHKKNSRVSELPLSAKESVDTQDSFNLEDKDPVEQTTCKKSMVEVSKQPLDNDKSERPAEEKGMLELDTQEDEENTNDLPLDRDTTSVPKQLGDEKSTAESKQERRESDKNTSERDTVRTQENFREEIIPQDHSNGKRPVKGNKKLSNNKEKTEESKMHMEDEIKKVKQDVPLNVLAGNNLPKLKKRPSVDSTPQSLKKQKILSEAQSESPDEDMSKCLSEVNERLSPTFCRQTRSKTKHLTSTDSRDSESLSLFLENSSDGVSDEPLHSCESSDESDFKVSAKRLVPPRERTRSEKTVKSPKALRTRSQRAAGVIEVVTSSESSSDSCDQQMTYTDDLTPQSGRSMDCRLEPSPESTEEPTNILIQQLGLNVSGINLYCSVTDTKISTNGDMANNSFERGKSIPALEAMLKERSNLDGVAREAFDLLPFEPKNLSSSGNNGSIERYLTNQELLVLQNICVLNPENPDVDMFYQILIQILLARKRVLLVPNSLSLLLVAEGVRREFNRAKRKGNYVLYLAQDWDANKIYTAEDFWLGNKRPPNVPSVCTVLSMFCLWKNLEKRVPISFPIALEELCRNLVLWDVDKIGTCVKLYSRYCTFLYEEKNPSLAEFFLNQPFVGSQTELQKKNLLCRMAENSKQTSGKSSFRHSFNVTENDVQMLMKKCMEAEQAVLRSSSPGDEENFRKSVQALKYKIDAYKKEIHLIQKGTKETEKKKSQLLSKLDDPELKDCTKELSKTVETLHRMLSKKTTKFEVIREVKSMSINETSRASRPPLVVLKGADLGEDVSESMKELVYELLMSDVKLEEVRPVLCAIVPNLNDKSLSVVPTNSWIRNFARVAGLKVRKHSNFLRW